MSIQRIIEIPLSEVQTKRGRENANSGNNPCLICGKEIGPSQTKYVHLLENGNIISYDGHDIEGSQGFFAIGKDCAKKLVIKFSF